MSDGFAMPNSLHALGQLIRTIERRVRTLESVPAATASGGAESVRIANFSFTFSSLNAASIVGSWYQDGQNASAYTETDFGTALDVAFNSSTHKLGSTTSGDYFWDVSYRVSGQVGGATTDAMLLRLSAPGVNDKRTLVIAGSDLTFSHQHRGLWLGADTLVAVSLQSPSPVTATITVAGSITQTAFA